MFDTFPPRQLIAVLFISQRNQYILFMVKCFNREQYHVQRTDNILLVNVTQNNISKPLPQPKLFYVERQHTHTQVGR